jgi:hypothetical protein
LSASAAGAAERAPHRPVQPGEWEARRGAVARRLYSVATEGLTDPVDGGRFFERGDTLAWYLFLCEAILQHPWNYDPLFGARVVPEIAAVGRELALLKAIHGADVRVARLVRAERAQPNGGLFELLVAAAYARAGGEVTFVPELKGIAKTHDMDVTLGGRRWAIECKRMEASEYGERERARMRELWNPPAAYLSHVGKSLITTVDFKVELKDVPDHYLSHRVQDFLLSEHSSLLWDDAIAAGSMGDLDLKPLQAVLATDDVLIASTRMQQLLTGSYARDASMLTALKVKFAGSPRYADACDLAVVCRWQCLAEAAISAKARDILRHVAAAAEQLPDDRPAVVHVGLEALNGDAVERARYAKVLASLKAFDPGSKQLEYVYCHYLAPESPPDGFFDYEETAHWQAIRPRAERPLRSPALVVPEGENMREGFLWNIEI